LPLGGKLELGVHQGTLAAEAGGHVPDAAGCEPQAIVTGTKTVGMFKVNKNPGLHLPGEIAWNNLLSLRMAVR
jgi:hypothetical protein